MTPDGLAPETILQRATETDAEALVAYLSRCTALHRDVAAMVRQQRQEPGIYNVNQAFTMLEALLSAVGEQPEL
jgi:hypothetical protein